MGFGRVGWGSGPCPFCVSEVMTPLMTSQYGRLSVAKLILIMYVYQALINALSAHTLIHI